MEAPVPANRPVSALITAWALLAALATAPHARLQAQVGNTCQMPIAITALPFDHGGNTVNYGNDYAASDVPPLAPNAVTNGNMNPNYLNGADVVYAYTPPADQVITVTTTNEPTWVGLWAFTGCPFTSTVGGHVYIAETTRAINHLPVQEGVTYYFVVSTWPEPMITEYTIHVQLDWVVEPCTGTPDPGATTGPASVCPGADAVLGLEHPMTAGGLSFQWQWSDDGDAWSNVPGPGTDSTYTALQGTAHWYRCQVSCSGGGTASSAPLHVGISPPSDCPCNTLQFGVVEPICHVGFADLDNASPDGINGSPGVEDFTHLVAHVARGGSYALSVTGNTNGWFTSWTKAFFDWDRDGVFEADVLVGSIADDACATPIAATVQVPADAAFGTSRMRIVKKNGSVPMDPCGTYNNGQAEDYTVEVSGTVGMEGPAAGARIALHPNPVRDELFLGVQAPVDVRVHDLLGQPLVQSDRVTRLDVSGLAPGTYVLTVMGRDGRIEGRSRFVKQ